MGKKYVLALDEGTTSCRTIVFDNDSNIVGVAQREFTQIFPKAGWVEHDANEIWSTQLGTIVEAIANAGITQEMSLQSVSLTSVKLLSYGIKTRASLYTTQSYGSPARRLLSLTN
jgi:glycerol kinase